MLEKAVELSSVSRLDASLVVTEPFATPELTVLTESFTYGQ